MPLSRLTLLTGLPLLLLAAGATPALALDEAQVSQPTCDGVLVSQRGLPPGAAVEIVAHDAQAGTTLTKTDATVPASGNLSLRIGVPLRGVKHLVVDVEHAGDEYGEAAMDVTSVCPADTGFSTRTASAVGGAVGLAVWAAGVGVVRARRPPRSQPEPVSVDA